jgi:hypothetical protein
LSCWRKEGKCKHQLVSGIFTPDTSWKVVQVTDCLGSNSLYTYIHGDSVARGPKLLSIKNYVIEIMTWKIIYTYRERCKTGPAHNRCWNWSPFTSKHTWMRFSKFWNTFPKFVWGPLARESPCIINLKYSIHMKHGTYKIGLCHWFSFITKHIYLTSNHITLTWCLLIYGLLSR